MGSPASDQQKTSLFKFHLTIFIYSIRQCHWLSEGLEVSELFQDSLLGDPELVDEASDGNHGKASVLDLSKAVPAYIVLYQQQESVSDSVMSNEILC